FQMALHLGEIEIRSVAALQQLGRIVEEVEPEVEQRRGDRLARDGGMLLVEMPASRTDEQRRRRLLERVLLSVRTCVPDLAPHGVAEIDLAFDDVAPRRRVRVLEV